MRILLKFSSKLKFQGSSPDVLDLLGMYGRRRNDALTSELPDAMQKMEAVTCQRHKRTNKWSTGCIEQMNVCTRYQNSRIARLKCCRFDDKWRMKGLSQCSFHEHSPFEIQNASIRAIKVQKVLYNALETILWMRTAQRRAYIILGEYLRQIYVRRNWPAKQTFRWLR